MAKLAFSGILPRQPPDNSWGKVEKLTSQSPQIFVSGSSHQRLGPVLSSPFPPYLFAFRIKIQPKIRVTT
jgi:hypothetical protein